MQTGTDTALLESSISGLPLVHRGKVRDTYEVDAEHLLLVASDRLSAFDVVFAEPIPDKGRVLSRLSAWWFERLADLGQTHFVSTRLADLPPEARSAELDGRAMLVRRAQRIDAECVVRGYLAGSGWAEYRRSGEVCGHRLPSGLRESERLPEPIFTPSTKAEVGHDENISRERLAELVGHELAAELEARSLALYRAGARRAEEVGLILADTKFEFGWIDGRVALIDELLTPDSSRFWDAELYRPGSSPPSFDKQYVRDFVSATGWDREPPAPALPSEVIAGTRERYVAAYERLTGEPWSAAPAPAGGSAHREPPA
jgi:phosphoribosylaminoimidazole-succinocarboxamide synthase